MTGGWRSRGQWRAKFLVRVARAIDTSDPEYARASRSSFGELAAESTERGGGDLAYGAWALVHGLTVLWLAENLPAQTLDEAQALLHRSARALAGGGRRR